MYDRLTKKDIEKMKEELEHRKLVVRKEAIKDVQEARAHGDLSENFEYKAAKQYKNQNESRIRYLERMIKTAIIIDEEDITDDDNKVGLNSIVTIYTLDEDLEETYKIVTTIRVNVLKRRISIESPLGKALLGHKVGDTVNIKINDNTSYEVIIRKIEKENEDNDEIRKY